MNGSLFLSAVKPQELNSNRYVIKLVSDTLCVLVRCINSPSTLDVDIGFLFSFFREIGLGEKETEFLLEKHPLLALTSLTLIRTNNTGDENGLCDGLTTHVCSNSFTICSISSF